MKTRSVVAAVVLSTGLPVHGLAFDEQAAAPQAESVRTSTDAPPVPLGSRVRIKVKDGTLVVGILSSWEPDVAGVLDDPKGKPFAIDRSAISYVEKSTGHRSHAGKGAMLGALIGGTFLAVAGGSVTLEGDPCGGGCAVAGGLVGAVAGGLVGAVVGLPFKTERFKRVSSPQAAEKNSNSAVIGVVTDSGAPPMPGQRVRVTTASPAFTGAMVGTLAKIGPDSLTLVDPKGGAVTELPLNSITGVEVSRRHRHTWTGLLIGLGIGVAGTIVISVVNEPTGLGFFASSVGIGAWLGYRTQSDEWSDAPVGRFKVTVRPERGGGRVALAFSF